MVEIRDRDEFEAWLEGREREVGTAIAARSALRVLPQIAEIFDTSFENPSANFALPTIRAIISSRVSAMQDTREEMIAKAASATASAASAASATAASATAASATAASAASASAASASDSASAASAASASASAAWEAISADAIAVEEGMSPADLSATPLWPAEPPGWVAEDWTKLTAALRAAPEEDWDVWIDWYEARLRGEPANLALEREIVLIPNETWEAGPTVVNAEVRRLIGEYAPPTKGDLPPEHTTAPRFHSNNNRIVVRPDKPTVEPNEDQIEFHLSLKRDIAALLDCCSPTSNRYGDVRQAGSDFAAALGNNYADTHRTKLWLAGRKLRTLARADEDRRAANDREDEPLDAAPGAALEHVVAVYNVFTSLDPVLKERDRAGVDQHVATVNAPAEIKAVRDAVVADTETFDEEVGEVLDGVIEESAAPDNAVAARGDTLVQMTIENLIISTASTVLQAETKADEKPKSEFTKAFTTASGGAFALGLFSGVAYAAGAFIATNKWALITLVAKWPAGGTLTTIIKHIAKIFGN